MRFEGSRGKRAKYLDPLSLRSLNFRIRERVRERVRIGLRNLIPQTLDSYGPSNLLLGIFYFFKISIHNIIVG